MSGLYNPSTATPTQAAGATTSQEEPGGQRLFQTNNAGPGVFNADDVMAFELAPEGEVAEVEELASSGERPAKTASPEPASSTRSTWIEANCHASAGGT